MPGGGLRILPNKTWHVWKRENIEKVERDERLHAEEQKTKEANEAKAQAQLRLEKLRKRYIYLENLLIW